MNTILKMEGIYKSFGGVHALVDVKLDVAKGEVHALLGENGAGKSTLMNVLTGVIPMDKGRIEFDGTVYPQPTIRQMEDAGIAFVHQELSVINDLTVYENIFLNREIRNKWHVLDKKQMIAKTQDLFARLGVNMDPMTMVSELKTSEKQLLEICRALHANAKLLILDEPVANLDPISRDAVWHLLDEWRHETHGTAIVCSHVLAEMDEWATDYAIIDCGQVLKAGKNPGAGAAPIASATHFEMEFASLVAREQIENALLAAGLVPTQISAKGETLGEIYREVINAKIF